MGFGWNTFQVLVELGKRMRIKLMKSAVIRPGKKINAWQLIITTTDTVSSISKLLFIFRAPCTFFSSLSQSFIKQQRVACTTFNIMLRWVAFPWNIQFQLMAGSKFSCCFLPFSLWRHDDDVASLHNQVDEKVNKHFQISSPRVKTTSNINIDYPVRFESTHSVYYTHSTPHSCRERERWKSVARQLGIKYR